MSALLYLTAALFQAPTMQKDRHPGCPITSTISCPGVAEHLAASPCRGRILQPPAQSVDQDCPISATTAKQAAWLPMTASRDVLNYVRRRC